MPMLGAVHARSLGAAWLWALVCSASEWEGTVLETVCEIHAASGMWTQALAHSANAASLLSLCPLDARCLPSLGERLRKGICGRQSTRQMEQIRRMIPASKYSGHPEGARRLEFQGSHVIPTDMLWYHQQRRPMLVSQRIKRHMTDAALLDAIWMAEQRVPCYYQQGGLN